MSAAPPGVATKRAPSLLSAIRAMPAAAPLPSGQWSPPTVTAQRAFDLRTRLAVRGWANPQSLFDPLERDEDFETALGVVAEEVETLVSVHPGCWYYEGQNRARVLADRGRAAVVAELGTFRCGKDANDPVRLALRMLYDLEPQPPLADLDIEVVRALGPARAWLGEAFDTPAQRGAIAAELARRERAADVERLTAGALVGAAREAAFIALKHEIERPFDATAGLTTSCVYGPGGAGKSTLIASLEKAIGGMSPMPLLLRMDFDDRRLDPFDPYALDLGFFEQLSIALPEAARTILAPTRLLRRMRRERRSTRVAAGTPSRKRAIAAESFAGGESLEDEGSTVYETSERDSVLRGFLAPGGPVMPAVPVLLMLDTLEVVSARGDAAVAELADWLDSLHRLFGCVDLRLFIAGRDPPETRPTDLASLLAARGHRHGVVVPAGELTTGEVAELLRKCGVADEVLVEAAAAVLPGNPLLVRTAAEALLGDCAEAARTAYRSGAIDQGAASTYLMNRIVAHLADPAARPYLLPAMYLPAVTVALLQNVVMPAIDRPSAAPPRPVAERVFRAFRAARWLTRASDDEHQLRFHADLRELVLTLLHADEAVQRPLAAAIRARAIAWLGRSKRAESRAWLFYHAALSGVPAMPPDPAETLAILAPVIGDLPAAAHQMLLGGVAARRAPPSSGVAPPVGAAEIEKTGARLVKRDRGAEALALYRDQPTRASPPTFAIQALADTGDWDSGEVDVEAELRPFADQAGRRLSSDRVSRLYWLTRFALLRDDGRISGTHAAVLRAACAPLANLAGFSALPPLVAVAEAGLEDAAPIAPEGWLAPASGSIAARLALVRVRRGAVSRTLQLRADHIAVAQRDWARRLRDASAAVADAAGASTIQSIVNQIDGDGFGAVGIKFGVLAKRRATLLPCDIGDAGAILLLRGPTTEFLRPLSHSLRRWFDAAGAREPLLDFMSAVSAAMTILPREFEPARFAEMVAVDPQAWIAALVGDAPPGPQRPTLCAAIAATPDDSVTAERCRAVARSFLAWDELLCGEHGSGWVAWRRQDTMRAD